MNGTLSVASKRYLRSENLRADFCNLTRGCSPDLRFVPRPARMGPVEGQTSPRERADLRAADANKAHAPERECRMDLLLLRPVLALSGPAQSKSAFSIRLGHATGVVGPTWECLEPNCKFALPGNGS